MTLLSFLQRLYGVPALAGVRPPKGGTTYGQIMLLATALTSSAAVDYDREIAPIFRSYCAGCHNANDMEGEFSLETYKSLREGGDKGDPIKPGKASDSYLVKVIEGRSKPKMPPRDEPQVPESDLAKLKAWISGGAHGPEKDASLFSQLVVPKLPPSKAPAPITALAYSPDGDRRATGYFGRVEIVTGDKTTTIQDLPGKVNGLEFSPDGKSLLIATGITGLKGLAQLRDATSGELLAEFGQHRDVLYDAAFSPDGTIVATAGYDHVIHLWDKGEGKLMRSLTAHQGAVFDLEFHPDGEVLASASADETVKLWRVADGVRLDTLSQPQGEQVSVRFTNGGDHIVSAGADKRLHYWEFISKKEPGINPVMHSRFAHESAITALALLSDGKHLVSSASDRTLKVWSLPELIEVRAEAPLADMVSTLAAIPQELKFAVATMRGEMKTFAFEAKGTADQGVPEANPVSLSEVSNADLSVLEEVEPNNAVSEALMLPLVSEVSGSVHTPGDVDHFKFSAKAGQALLLAVDAARSGSSLDSKIEVLDHVGNPIEQVRLQATRDSWFTFRGKDSDASGDFRVHNWEEMELNEYLYANGEVTRLWLYPRGPDSGFKVYPGSGKRHAYFSTTALSHPLGAPCYIVSPLQPGAKVVPNGLPVYTVYWENDDDPLRRWGTDSQLWFDVPEDGDYVIRLTDVRGFGGEDYGYKLSLRDRRPDFEVTVGGKSPKVSPGSAREINFTVARHEGFDGEIRIDIENLPEGYTASTPMFIQAEQHLAIGVIHASSSAQDPSEEADKAVKITATGKLGDRVLTKELGGLGDIQLGKPAKVTVEVHPSDPNQPLPETGEPFVLQIHPGETISARVVAQRLDFEGRIELGGDDSGRNLPHGLYVDNIGLNGLLIVEGQSEREFVITAAPWVPAGRRHFHLRTTADGGQASSRVLIEVLGDRL